MVTAWPGRRPTARTWQVAASCRAGTRQADILRLVDNADRVIAVGVAETRCQDLGLLLAWPLGRSVCPLIPSTCRTSGMLASAAATSSRPALGDLSGDVGGERITECRGRNLGLE